MGVGVVLAGAVVEVLAGGAVRGQLFQPTVIVLVETTLVIVYQKNTTAG